jgi:hypothetical protein
MINVFQMYKKYKEYREYTKCFGFSGQVRLKIALGLATKPDPMVLSPARGRNQRFFPSLLSLAPFESCLTILPFVKSHLTL